MNRPPWRGMRARVLLVVVAAGAITVAIVTAAVVTLVEHDKEAWVAQQLVHEALRAQSAAAHRVELARSELRVEALAIEAGDLAQLNRESGDGSPRAVLVYRGDEEVYAASVDEASLDALRGSEHPAPGRLRRLDHSRVVVVERAAGMRVVGLVDLHGEVPSGWSRRLVASDSDSTLVVAHQIEGDRMRAEARVDEGMALVMEAPLGPARVAAFEISSDVVAWSLLALLPLLLLAWVLSRAVTSPLLRLASAVRSARGGSVVLPPLPDDEIGDVGAAVAQLSARLDGHINGLARAVRFSRRASIHDGPASVFADLTATAADVLPGWRVVADEHAEPPSPLGETGGAADPMAQVRLVNAAAMVRVAEGGRVHGALIKEREATEPEARLAELLARTAVSRLRNAELSRAAAIDDKLRTLGQLAASVAHEMNTPLAFVNANLMALDDEVGGTDARAMISDAQVGVDRLIRIVRDLSAASVGGSVASHELADVGRLAHDMIRMARARRPLGEVSVTVEGATTASCDRGRIEQVILNLVNNALDAAGTDGRVRVLVRGQNRRVRVRVEDDGPGIPADVADKLFEAFYTTKKDEGTGLGLFISRSFAEAHGGTLELAHTRPGSTAFELLLPASSKPLPSDPPALIQPPALAHRPRVLIVDDDAAVVRAMTRWLRRRADVSGTTDPHDALRQIASARFDLVLTDLRMPSMGGVELARQARARMGVETPRIVIVTGSGGEVPTDLPVVRKPLDARHLEQLLGPQLEAAE